MPTSFSPEFPLSIIILSYIATFLLAVILLVLFRISSQLTLLSGSMAKSSRPTKATEKEELPNISEPEPGSPFDEFLTEDPERKNLTKKEQFKAYRKWRSEKGLNWSNANPDA
ncbi:hypothetical protein [Luteolibacter sp. AS25]|uniref:hypothetical protein n=1 Tax=Luteolibacter sp. AS25 TaxID=3135776 RepID=UPI00398B7E60